MKTNKCTYCERIASRKFNKEWVCFEHLGKQGGTPLPRGASRPYGMGVGATKTDPEKWKEYNREYRANYRLTHPRTDKKLAIYWKKRIPDFGLWLIGNPTSQDQAYYHCETCCSQVLITKREVKIPKKRRYAVTESWYWRKGGRYTDNTSYEVDLINAIKHDCRECLHTDIKYVTCDRCGAEGTNRVIHPYYNQDTLCPDCWLVVRPYYKIEHEYDQLMGTLSEFRSIMRKAGFNTNHRMKVNSYWQYDSGLYFLYRENWYKYKNDKNWKYSIERIKERQSTNWTQES